MFNWFNICVNFKQHIKNIIFLILKTTMENKKDIINILVTGGCGFIGSHTCVELLEKGYSVIIVDNLINSSSQVIKKIEIIVNDPKIPRIILLISKLKIK